MPNTNRSNCVLDSPPIQQQKDNECTQVVSGPIHTHKQSKTSATRSKRTRSRSASKPAKKRKVSRSKSRKTSGKEQKRKQCKVVVRKVCKVVKLKRKPVKPKASCIRPRAVGRVKKVKKQKLMKKAKSGSKSCRIRKEKSTPRKSPSKRKQKKLRKIAKKDKKSLSASKCRIAKKTAQKRPRSVSRKPKAKKAKVTSPKKISAGQSVIRMISARVSPCAEKHKAKSKPKVKAARSPSGEWSKRLRPRPLKSAKFTCYSQACLTKTVEKPKPKKEKRVKSPKKKTIKKRKQSRNVCGKNVNNLYEDSTERLGQSVDRTTLGTPLEVEQFSDNEVVNNHCCTELPEPELSHITHRMTEPEMGTLDSTVHSA